VSVVIGKRSLLPQIELDKTSGGRGGGRASSGHRSGAIPLDYALGEDNMKTILAITAVALLGVGAPYAHAQEDAPRAISVSYADLDLSRASGREALERRVSNAVALVCAPRPTIIELPQTRLYNMCMAQAAAGARQQLAEVYRGRLVARASIEVRPGRR
jgi:UrcA family protein